MRRFALVGLAVLLGLAAGCSADEPTTTYTVRVESGFGGPVNWTSVVDNGARDGGTVQLTSAQSAGINLDLTPGQRASVQVAIEPGRLGYAICQPFLGEQPLAPKLSQEGGSARLGIKPPVTCEVVAR